MGDGREREGDGRERDGREEEEEKGRERGVKRGRWERGREKQWRRWGEHKTVTYSRETRQEQREKAKAMKAFAMFKHT